MAKKPVQEDGPKVSVISAVNPPKEINVPIAKCRVKNISDSVTATMIGGNTITLKPGEEYAIDLPLAMKFFGNVKMYAILQSK